MRSHNLFYNLRGCVATDCAENFVTEALCWVCASNKNVGGTLLHRVLREAGVVADVAGATWSTQVRLPAVQSEVRRPDMVCQCPSVVFIFEHKVEEAVDPAQIAGHRQLALSRFAPRKIVSVLVARNIDGYRNAADVCLTWREVQAELRRSFELTDAAPGSLLGQFVEFLGMEGLGRIPGPCPTYWKGNILEAKRRHPAFPNGYVDLGRKFGMSILPGAIEEMSEDQIADQQHLLESLKYARECEDAPSAIWRFCCTFFPSYVRYTDDRSGVTLLIPEKKGRLFALGIMERLDEGDLAMYLNELP